LISKDTIIKLENSLEGELYCDEIHQLIYSTDASAYKEKPQIIIIPKNTSDVKKCIEFVSSNGLSIIPRTAGTSLAGQVVGGGMVLDCSKYMNKILELNEEEKWVKVQPGVVLDELNLYLKDYGLFFGPETSTSNRCMIGGMVGNNSCGAHSLVYGSTREHTLEISAILSDGSEVVFSSLSNEEFKKKTKLASLEGKIYRQICKQLAKKEIRKRIEKEFPDPDIERRNTGYAIDLLSQMTPFTEGGREFNFSSLLCGSEGTLAFITEIKLNLVPLPPVDKGLLVVHHQSVEEALHANIVALEHSPVAIELIDKFLLDCTKTSAEHKSNRFFLKGDPGALLCIELVGNSRAEVEASAASIKESFESKNYGFSFPLLFGEEISKVWALRKAGLGLLSNIPGDAKPQPVIEDTAVSPVKLPDYIAEFNEVLKANNLECVYYAHIATGELHLRPLLNLKDNEGVRLFRVVADEIARLVKKYGGSLSGEHGDGRLRGEFIPFMIGEENYQLLRAIKSTWDPTGVFNTGKITDTPPMDSSLRFSPGQQTPEFNTIYDFSDTLGMVRMAEKCNGSADCRKSEIIGGTMCPSFQATKDERNTTRARANSLREILNKEGKANRFNDKNLYEILDLCLSCKGCKTECPSEVDMAKLKSEFLYHYYKSNTRPLRQYLIAHFSISQKLADYIPNLYNYLINSKSASGILKKSIGFAKKRSLPKVSKVSWEKWLKRKLENQNQQITSPKGELYLFVDEFTNYNESELGILTTKLLTLLGYKVDYVKHSESGRAKMSKGFLRNARSIAERNLQIFEKLVTEEKPLVGIEPSAILSFRDEYPELLRGEQQESARKLSKHVFTIEEFLLREFSKGKIQKQQFSRSSLSIKYHGHCQQKAIVGTDPARQILEIPENYSVEEVKSGCCGMAGSFGYEKEHFELSMKIGELVLFPKVREASLNEKIVASGTSCRHHIKDGTGKSVIHPVEILWEALTKN
jgi:FAD/FMN-containing dehydrogenase/Fe-S oxidoreductase